MTNEEIEAIRKQAEKALRAITPDEFANEAVEIIEHDIPNLLAEIERLKKFERAFDGPVNIVATKNGQTTAKFIGITLDIEGADA